MDQTRTGALIRALRQNKQLTQRQLADAIGVSDKAVSKWERGCGAPDISLLRARHAAVVLHAARAVRAEDRRAQKVSRNSKGVPVKGRPCCKLQNENIHALYHAVTAWRYARRKPLLSAS